MECKSSPEKSVSNDALTFEMFLCSWKALGCHPDHNHRVSNVAQERNPLVTKIKSFSQGKTESIFFSASSGFRSPKQSVSESLPDEEQEQQEAGSQDATATSPKPKIDEAAKKGRYQ